MAFLGWILLVSGACFLVTGLIAFVGLVLKSWSSWNAGAKNLDTVSDWTKLLEAISKAPLWLAGTVVGDFQMWCGLSLINGKIPFMTLMG